MTSYLNYSHKPGTVNQGNQAHNSSNAIKFPSKNIKLDIGVFAECYPDTFKAYLDWQIIELIKQGNKVTIYAHGAWDDIIDPEVIQYNLHKKVVRYPSTLKDLPRTLFSLRFSKIAWYLYVTRVVWNQPVSFKKKIVNALRAATLKVHHDVCLINNLATAGYFTFIKDLFPSSCIMLYYHGAPLPGIYRGYMKDRGKIFDMADIIFTNSKYSAENLIELGCSKKKIIVIPVGINLDKFTPPKNKVYKKEGILRVISIGRISPEKGFLCAVEAIDILIKKGYNNVSYNIIGNGPQEIELYNKVKSLNLTEKVYLIGAKSNTEVIKHLSQSDVFLLPSVPCQGCTETQGVVIQEAQAMKLPVIATNVGGIPEGLLDCCSGFLVEPFSSQAIAEKLIKLISLPPSKFAELGESGRKFIESKYRIEHLTTQLRSHMLNWLKINRKM